MEGECTCHLCPPCPFCESLSEEEVEQMYTGRVQKKQKGRNTEMPTFTNVTCYAEGCTELVEVAGTPDPSRKYFCEKCDAVETERQEESVKATTARCSECRKEKDSFEFSHGGDNNICYDCACMAGAKAFDKKLKKITRGDWSDRFTACVGFVGSCIGLVVVVFVAAIVLRALSYVTSFAWGLF